MLVMTSRATAVDAGVSVHRRLHIFVPEELPDGLERSRLSIEQNFCA
jgi:hypothetical protein